MRRVLLEKLQGETFENVLKILKNETEKNSRFAKQYSYVDKFIRGELFDIQEKLNQKVAENVDYYFNQCINCGGYALKVDICVFPKRGGFEKNISGILESFPFVRLLGDTKLEDDEYLVLYRSSDTEGHHFIRIEDDGTVVEKWDCQTPQRFQTWGSLEKSPEAVFAVKKEHDMEYSKKERSIVIPTDTSKNFEETVFQAIQNRNNTFEYHNHKYTFKKSRR